MSIAARFVPLIAGAAALSAAVASVAFAQGGGLPDGPGKAELQSNCTACHGLDQIISQRKSQDDWADTVSKMVSFGATVSADQQTAIIAYLSTNFGKGGAAPAAGASPAAGAAPATPTPDAAPPAAPPATPQTPPPKAR